MCGRNARRIQINRVPAGRLHNRHAFAGNVVAQKRGRAMRYFKYSSSSASFNTPPRLLPGRGPQAHRYVGNPSVKISRSFSCCARRSSLVQRKPQYSPAIFFADIVQPSAWANISRATRRAAFCPAYPSSRSLMKYAFSANRHASMYGGMPCFRHSCFTSRILAMETGWPPPELL